MYFAVYEKATGRLHAIEREIGKAGVPEGMAYKEVPEYAGLHWDTETLEFDPDLRTVRVLSRGEFLDRLTIDEWVRMVAAKGTDPMIDALFERLRMVDQVDLDSEITRAMAEHVIKIGYLSAERVAEIVR